MSVDFFVVRHAVAFERDAGRWSDDAERPLTPQGEQSFRRCARGLAALIEPVEAVLASRFVRSWRTAEILHETAAWPKPEAMEALEADRTAEELLAELAARDTEERLAIVGHEPMLSDLCGIRSGGGAPELKKGAIVRLAVVVPCAGCCPPECCAASPRNSR